MERISVGDIVFVNFPFSDLSAVKKRPALVLATLDYNDLILCQITSRSYADANAIQIQGDSFQSGSLIKISYIRPSKLFTANTSIIHKKVARLKNVVQQSVTLQIIKLLSQA